MQYEDFYVIDAHCDTLMALTGRSMHKEEKTRRDFFADNPGTHLDLPKLIRGRVVCQVMAIFLEDEQLPHATEEAMAMIDALDEVLEQGGPDFFPGEERCRDPQSHSREACERFAFDRGR